MFKGLKKTAFTFLFVAVFAFTASCGYILYPERRSGGAKGGKVDVSVVVMDCLWLLPAVVPGLVALLVDGLTGAWYQSGGSSVLGQNTSKSQPLQLVAGKDHLLNVRNTLYDSGEASLYMISASGQKVLLDKTKAGQKGFIFKFKLDKNQNQNSTLLLVVLNKKKLWFNARIFN
ncbi:MAG: hypothetical protein PF689_08980 [Deltaproteobacteria bacterium]|jgi:hypothetical protein|nr:hypothetical protein [Deltaproteobacteria bacterium]